MPAAPRAECDNFVIVTDSWHGDHQSTTFVRKGPDEHGTAAVRVTLPAGPGQGTDSCKSA
jgi:hypothetical protein